MNTLNLILIIAVISAIVLQVIIISYFLFNRRIPEVVLGTPAKIVILIINAGLVRPFNIQFGLKRKAFYTSYRHTMTTQS